MKQHHDTRLESAYDAIAEAQRIAFAPVVFQAVRALRQLGILERLDAAGDEGVMPATLASELQLTDYGIRVLLESGLSAGVVRRADSGRFMLGKTGYFILHDRMTQVNMDFVHDVCYLGLHDLDTAIVEGRPAGLASIDTQHKTVYEALSCLPDPVRQSWFAFDHYYSDTAYPVALEHVRRHAPASLVDIGANRGRFSILAARADDQLHITMVDLPAQVDEALHDVAEAGFASRIAAVGIDIRDRRAALPTQRDAYWLSQFLCCFSVAEVIGILKKVRAAMDPSSRLYILETCWDRQRHEAAAFSIINTSPYFTCIANGNSKMYSADDMHEMIEAAGLQCMEVTDDVGHFHTLFECVTG